MDPIINEWFKVHRDYIEEFDFKDSLYWYNERANISALSGAVWKCSAFALEEYTSMKGEKSKKWKGRVDLYMCLGKNDAVIEAKIHWLYLHDKQEINYINAIEKLTMKS